MEASVSPIFSELLLVLVVAIIVVLTFERLRIPTTLGFLIAGVMIGPYGLGLIADVNRIHLIAEPGIILLMFTIGIEFSFEKLTGLKRIAVRGGLLQIAATIFVTMAVTHFFNLSYYRGFLCGAVIALSSTAIILKHLIDKAELDTQHGRIAIAILIFQDLAFVPLLIISHALGEPSMSIAAGLFGAFIKTLIFIAFVYVCGRIAIPKCLTYISQTKNREVFFLSIIVICFGMAWLGTLFGLSMAIGAFFAGLILANTDFGSQIAGDTVPLRHIFVSFFFVSLGLLFDPGFVIQHWRFLIPTVLLIICVKTFITTCAILSLGYSLRIALTAGLTLSQIGEFSFLLLESARSHGAIDAVFYQMVLSAAFLTIFSAPFLFGILPALASVSKYIPLFGQPPGQIHKGLAGLGGKKLSDHIIICGYGKVAADIITALKSEGVDYIIIEMNAHNVARAKDAGDKVIFGDASNALVMQKAGIAKARAVVVSFADAIGMKQIARLIQGLSPKTLLFVRTRFEQEVAALYEIGVDIVVMEELEASIEINKQLLRSLEIPPEKIDHHLKRIRQRKELAIEESILKKIE